MKRFIGLIIFVCLIFVCCGSFFALKKINPALYLNMIAKFNPNVQKDFQTKASITSIKNEIKLVTAKQDLDFIILMDGVNGHLIQINTYEIKAGVDFNSSKGEKNKVSIFEKESDIKGDPVILRNLYKVDNSELLNYLNPVKAAYRQKAFDYAVNNGILEKAKEQAESTLYRLTGNKVTFDINENYILKKEIPFLPLQFEVSQSYFEEKLEEENPCKNDAYGFVRDCMIFKPKNTNVDWKIRIGDTGITYKETFDKFYKNVLDTNTQEALSDKDKVQLFRYFDPMNPEEKICLSYASDYYRTFFVYSKTNSSIYYMDSFCDNESELTDATVIRDIAPVMIYLAASIKESDKTKAYKNEYRDYIKQFYETTQSIKNEENALTYKNYVNKLLAKNSTRKEENYSEDEKLFMALNDVKQKSENIYKTENQYLDSITSLLNELQTDENFDTPEKRDFAADEITNVYDNIKKRYKLNNEKKENLLQSYYAAWLLQNNVRNKLDEKEIKDYENILKSNNELIYRPALIDMKDNERNQCFYDLFAKRIFNSRRFVDTALKPEDILDFEEYGHNNIFAFMNIYEYEKPDASIIYSNIKKMNKDRDISDKFILVYKQTEFSLDIAGENIFENTDVHAIVLDEATLRFFPTVGFGFNEDKVFKWIKSIFKDDYPPYYYYGDYSNLQIGRNGLTINGKTLGTKKLTKAGKQQYRKSNDYAEISEVLKILCDIQRAYYLEDKDYYYSKMLSTLQDEINHYVFDCTFRPNPRLTVDTQKDMQMRINKNY